VTGRRRRCGWLDLVALRYAVRVNSLTKLFVTKLDILSAFETIKVATGYRSKGERYDEVPSQQSVLYHCEPEYDELPGWNTDITGIREFRNLPQEARDYIHYIQTAAEVEVGWVSVGPERSQLITVS
jgi:adenylosuccinate synthase